MADDARILAHAVRRWARARQDHDEHEPALAVGEFAGAEPCACHDCELYRVALSLRLAEQENKP